MHANMPSLNSWSGTAQNRCGNDRDILSCWITHDSVTFLASPGSFPPALPSLLTGEEREREQQYLTASGRRRFVLSRSILRYILSCILRKDSAEVILVRDREGRVHVRDRPDIFISLSYSGEHIAITLGKQKLGSDIEVVRPVQDRKITGSPLFLAYGYPEEKDRVSRVLQFWTMVESCAKLYDTNPYPLLNRTSFAGTSFASYCIDRKAILSLASVRELLHEVVWFDCAMMANAPSQS